MKKIMTMLAAVLISAAAFAQLTPSQLVTWTPSVEALDGDVYRVVFTGKVAEGYHTYTLTDEFSATEVMDPAVEGGELVGKPYELSTPKEELDEFGDPAKHYYNEIIIAQDVKVTSSNAAFTGTIFSNACTGGACKAEYYDFDVKVGKSTAVAASSNAGEAAAISSGDEETEEREGSIWGLILEAILWGFAMLLTPCVFPMVPMTVSFFMKGSGSVAH